MPTTDRTYATAKSAFRRQRYLAETYGIMSAVRKVGDRYELLCNPDASELIPIET